jgi:Rieske Fe-S protein
MERREFVRNCLLGIISAFGVIVLAYPVLSFLTFRKSSKKTIVFHADEQLSMVNYKEGVYLVTRGNETHVYSASCTHLGCTLNYDVVSQRLRCPCHGSIFDLSGKWLSGPAKKDLFRIPLSRKANKDVVVTIIL